MADAPRLYIDADRFAAPTAGARIVLDDDQAHYLRAVMRREDGAALAVFNGRDGEWAARLVAIGKRGAAVDLDHQTRAPAPERRLELIMAPVKRGPVELAVEKATELGVTAIRFAITRRTVVDRLRLDRLTAIAREAAEQCERLSLPLIVEAAPLDAVLDRVQSEASAAADGPLPVLFGDETGGGVALAMAAAGLAGAPVGLLVGPEGGFDPAELDRLRARPHVTAIGLGPRVLRAETAAIAGLAVLQALAPEGGGPRCRQAVP
ncbi:ribosomal RNA small subunit methyltransferase E [Tistrella bauzanensis]|uniref:Ribosomal RNA small subunit methyltransferase E n=1 Tax=Tistrella bauzanensis TaxID=657419 RepID=A0ABQ1IMH1_9PROT|nr:16S rRNA (uracil(1498)-N(3))-methyltransferase [Tistrella bauzanensis]GGB45885.1 ribosomal RNA small subunit methyltransferase E [Tistrella bauzanensis]